MKIYPPIKKRTFYSSYGKRIFDLVLAVSGLVILWPVLLLISLAIWFYMGRPIIFKQTRPGLHGKPFTLYKFRTMSEAKDAKGNLLPNKQRLSTVGRILRSTSLDELPELLNVLKGDMSIVGPRPLLMDYLPLYTEDEKRRHEVPGGITGLAQISGRNDLEFKDRFLLDLDYIDNLSLALDIKIILRTFAKVIGQDSIIVDERTLRHRFEKSRLPIKE